MAGRKRQPLTERIRDLEQRLAQAEETLRALRAGELDGVVHGSADGDRIHPLAGAGEAYRVMVEGMAEGALTLTAGGLILFSNERFATMIGRPLEGVIGSRIQDCIDPEDFEKVASFLRGTGRRKVEARLKTRAGATVPSYLSAENLPAGGAGSICLIVTDLSEQKRNAEIVGAEKLASSILEQAAEAMVVVDTGGLINRASRSADELAGLPVAGRTFDEVFQISLVSGRSYPFQQILATARARPIHNSEVTVATPDGRKIDLLLGAAPLSSPGFELLGCVVTLIDITERKRTERQQVELWARERNLAAERALRETEAELARVARALSVGELATSIAHEVNQPLAAVITNAEAALRWMGQDSPNLDEVRKSLELIVKDGNRASEVIRRIREFLRKESRERDWLDINDVIQEALALAHSALLKSRIILQIELAEDLPRMCGDRIQLQQVILNLIVNSLEAMESVGGPRDLLVTSRRFTDSNGQPGVLVSVCDAGTGVTPEDLQRIFEAFFTRKTGGMGLGLSISRSIVEAHGGRIWAEVNETAGLTVQFSLPLEPGR